MTDRTTGRLDRALARATLKQDGLGPNPHLERKSLKGIRQYQVADEMGISRQWLGELETKRDFWPLETITLYREAYGRITARRAARGGDDK